MDLPTAEELTSLMAKLNYEVMKARSEAAACRSALRGYLASKGESEDMLDDVIAKGAANILNARLEHAEQLSPAAAALVDQRSAEEMDLIQYEVIEQLRKKRGEG